MPEISKIANETNSPQPVIPQLSPINTTPVLINPAAGTVPSTTTNTTSTPNKKRGKYLPEEDLIMVRKVAAARAHVAKYGETREKLLQAANRFNQNPQMRQQATWKGLQDRYKRLQEDFVMDDLRRRNLSGIGGGEMGDLYQSLSLMREERDSFLKEKDTDKSVKSRREEEKERMCRRVVDMALKQTQSREGSNTEEGNESSLGTEDNGDESDSVKPDVGRKAKRQQIRSDHMAEGVEAFGAHLKEADMARIDLERKKLTFEREKHKLELVERTEDREERRRERQDTQRFELEKFRMMFDAFKELRK